MKKTKKILVPVAFSEHSADLISYAAILANALDAELILANIINERDVETLQKVASYGYKIDEDQYLKEVETERTSEINSMMKSIDFPGDRVTILFKIGRPAKSLLKLAVQEDIDMIVMGIRDRTDFIHSLTGSVAEKMFRRSPVTIVSFRDEKNAGHLRKKIMD